MFSLTPGAKKKTKPHPKANKPLDREGKKQAKQFAKGVERFLRYNKDIISEKRYEEIAGMRDEFVSDMREGKKLRKEFEKQSDEIAKVCKRAKPNFQNSVIKENIEVLFVAIVIAMGIRAYFVQQFKIPTGSMQPTLNGIIAYKSPKSYGYSSPDQRGGYKYNMAGDFEMPNLVKKLVEKIWFGRTYVEWVAKEDDSITPVLEESFNSQGMRTGYRKVPPIIDAPIAILLPRAKLKTDKGHFYSTSGTKSKASKLLTYYEGGASTINFKKGDIIAQGYLETGDMLVVNKMAYHWRKPKRGEVFVFNTRNINDIQSGIVETRNGPVTQAELYGSQHYIKRLCGVPNDQIIIREPVGGTTAKLLVNGELAKERGIAKVNSGEGLYRPGYTLGQRSVFHEIEGQSFKQNVYNLGPREYLALGDNSQESSDSRSWGKVPQENIVGKAVFVFYPFGNHFGPIK